MHITAADYPEREKRFEVVYELFSSKSYTRVRVKSEIAENESIPSAVSVWESANWFEREVYDMYGIQFEGHPNLTRILVHHQFVGHPLRKDYDANKQQHCTEPCPSIFKMTITTNQIPTRIWCH